MEPSHLLIEDMIAEPVFEELKKLGHEVRIVNKLGNAHALRILYDATGERSHFEGAADLRGEGTAEGF